MVSAARSRRGIDGLAFWKPFKALLDDADRSSSFSFEWRPRWSDAARRKIMSLIEYTENGYGERHIVESSHFAIQTVRIPDSEKPTLRKLIQVALNVGQGLAKPASGAKLPKSHVKGSWYVGADVLRTRLERVLPGPSLQKLEDLLAH